MKIVARPLVDLTKKQIQEAVEQLGRRPVLGIITGVDEASQVYLQMRGKVAAQLGIDVVVQSVDQQISGADFRQLLQEFNQDPKIDGYIVDRPYPQAVDEGLVASNVAPEKDVDAISLVNQGKLLMGLPGCVGATPRSVLALIETVTTVDGKDVLVIGRSVSLGRPLANYLNNHHATVTLAHTHTKDLKALTQRADIVIVAINRPQLITADYFKAGAIIIDCGIHVIDDQVVGDVREADKADFTATPVPGGVGPLTTVFLFDNLLKLIND